MVWSHHISYGNNAWHTLYYTIILYYTTIIILGGNNTKPNYLVWYCCLNDFLCVTTKETNKSMDVGWISADRRTSLLSRLQYPDQKQSRLQRISRAPWVEGWSHAVLLSFSREYCYCVNTEARLHFFRNAYRRISSVDSRLEAFSGNPTDGSFAALAVQPTA